MVPGMTERERLAADMRRAEWLAEAVLGPVQVNRSPARRLSALPRESVHILAAARALVRRIRIRWFLSRPTKVAARRVPVQSR